MKDFIDNRTEFQKEITKHAFSLMAKQHSTLTTHHKRMKQSKSLYHQGTMVGQPPMVKFEHEKMLRTQSIMKKGVYDTHNASKIASRKKFEPLSPKNDYEMVNGQKVPKKKDIFFEQKISNLKSEIQSYYSSNGFKYKKIKEIAVKAHSRNK